MASVKIIRLKLFLPASGSGLKMCLTAFVGFEVEQMLLGQHESPFLERICIKAFLVESALPLI